MRPSVGGAGHVVCVHVAWSFLVWSRRCGSSKVGQMVVFLGAGGWWGRGLGWGLVGVGWCVSGGLCGCVSRGPPCHRSPGCVGGGGRAACVVCVRRCPALPHPGGCSTIGAGGLSFRVRYGAGRGSPAVTTGTCVGLCAAPWRAGLAPGCPSWCAQGVCGCVWGGLVLRPYSGRGLWCPGCGPPSRSVLGGVCCLCRPVSTGRLAGPCGPSTSGLSTQWSAGGLPTTPGGVVVDTLS